MKYLLCYKASGEELSSVGESHRAHARRFYADGTLLMLGTVADSGGYTVMGIFTSGLAAEEFATSDPLACSVGDGYQVRDWDDVFDDGTSEADLIREWNKIVVDPNRVPYLARPLVNS